MPRVAIRAAMRTRSRSSAAWGISPRSLLWAERRLRGRLAAAGSGAKLAVRRKQLPPRVPGQLHIDLEQGGAACPPRLDIVARELDDPHSLLRGIRVGIGSDPG